MSALNQIVGRFVCGAVLVLACSSAFSADPYSRSSAFESDWRIHPDPPSQDQDLQVFYDGFDESVSIEIEGEDSVVVDITSGSYTIPKSKLRGKRFVKLKASGGEDGYRIVRFPTP